VAALDARTSRPALISRAGSREYRLYILKALPRQIFIHQQTGDGHLGSRHHPKILFCVVIQVVGELRQLSGAEQGGALTMKGVYCSV